MPPHVQPLLWVWWEVNLPGWQQQQLCRLLQVLRTSDIPTMKDIWLLNPASVEAFLRPGYRLKLEGLGAQPVRVLRETLDPEALGGLGHARRPPRRLSGPLEAVFYTLIGPKPPVEDSLILGERVRRALLKLRAPAGFSPMLVGKREDQIPLEGNAHAYFVPMDTDGDGLLDEVLVYAPAGFSASDRDAFGQLRFLSGDDAHGLGMTLHLEGSLDGLRRDAGCQVLDASRVWVSATPFSLPFFASGGKGRQPRPRDLPEGQLRRELRTRGFPEPLKITLREGWTDGQGRLHPWSDFCQERRNQTRGNGLAGFRVEFEAPVEGPILVGFGCHFGLGVFVPDGQEPIGPSNGRPV